MSILKRYSVQLLFITAAILLVFNLGAPPIYILDEAKNAQAAREMLENHEAVVPTFNAEPRLHKPPLHYYFMQAGYMMFGINAFGARFFSALMGWLTIWLTWYFTKRFIGRRPAFWAAATLLLSTQFMFEFRLAVPDPYLIFFFTAGICCFYAYMMEGRIRWLLLSALAVALAALAKGPVALLLTGSSLFCWTLLAGRWQALWTWKILLYGAVILAVATPWYIAVHIATDGAFTREFFFTHNLSRFSSPMEGHGGSPLLIPLFALAGLLPLSFFLPVALRQKSALYGNRFFLLSLCVAVITMLFFSLSGTKLPNYPMPCYPFLAIVAGCGVAKLLSPGSARYGRYAFWCLLVVSIALLIAAYIALSYEKTLTGTAYLPLAFLIPVVTVGMGLLRLYRHGVKAALFILIPGYAVFNLVAVSWVYPAIYRQNPVAKTMHLFRPGERVYAYRLYNPAFNFYLNKPITVIRDETSLRELLIRSPDAKVIGRAQELEALPGIPVRILAKEKDLFERPVTVIFSGR